MIRILLLLVVFVVIFIIASAAIYGGSKLIIMWRNTLHKWRVQREVEKKRIALEADEEFRKSMAEFEEFLKSEKNAKT